MDWGWYLSKIGELCPQINIHKKYHNLNLLPICYLLIFTLDPFGLSAFYKNVFDWMKSLSNNRMVLMN